MKKLITFILLSAVLFSSVSIPVSAAISNFGFGDNMKSAMFYLLNEGLYVILDFHNSAMHIMSVEARKMSAESAQEKNLFVIENGINNFERKDTYEKIIVGL